jgi:hypothetical protein
LSHGTVPALFCNASLDQSSPLLPDNEAKNAEKRLSVVRHDDDEAMELNNETHA